MEKLVKVACVQAAPVFLDLSGTVDKTIALIKEAADNGAELIAFPETWIPGYPWFLWLDSPAANMPLVYQYHQNSLTLDSGHAQKITDAAKQYNIFVVLGFSEKDHGSLYISQWIIDNKGQTVGNRRKLKATHVERTLFGESDGSSLQVYETDLGRVGALCCWEHLQPLGRYAMYSQHEQIHIAAWPSFSLYTGTTAALGPDVNNAASRLYAAEGQCFVIASCAIVSKEMHEFLCTDDTKKQLLNIGGGHARIYGPDGSDLVEPLAEDEEGILYATLNLAAITFAKTATDPVGHYSRPDVFQLVFNAKHKPKVIQQAPIQRMPVDPAQDTVDSELELQGE
ncbi:carbon-nitrogen hydrolase family protein [Acinetobacter sp. V91_7]|uniref:carbon-nitrogen hydrolase family protein n=1 Tax=unclassified Acinetobacter TaxID=196816 RepID=UPI00287D2BB9|nr:MULTISPECIES: carbon-nitrogen hydrolase family protein [unclassified Acinetobacter]MDS7932891.1 carbon-nitrogen hydrolase family protein [Acinetobacter sp. V91_4B]MDS7961848.1 carbon-nitrogen hydrolase family protein [Acinetobacter sp. V91_7]MDS8028921.1 carbon-nitrogen hydrolase family protein [Acinetobacter sp. V91_13]